MVKLNAAGRCIYCLSEAAVRTSEHIIPLALSGIFELPDASCADCQVHINSKIESPVLSDTLKPYRAYFNYKSRRKRKLVTFSWRVEIFDEASPLGREIEVPIANVPIPKFMFTLRVPPIFALRSKEYALERPIDDYVRWTNIGSPSRDQRLHREIIENNAIGRFFKIIYESPTLHVGKFDALLGKIACGFFFDAVQESYLESGLGFDLVSSDIVNSKKLQEVYSLPCSAYPIPDHEVARVFSVCEAARVFSYCAFRLLPEALGQIYFVRIPAVDGSSLSKMTAYYADGSRRVIESGAH